jgi:hypothetical protein
MLPGKEQGGDRRLKAGQSGPPLIPARPCAGRESFVVVRLQRTSLSLADHPKEEYPWFWVGGTLKGEQVNDR